MSQTIVDGPTRQVLSPSCTRSTIPQTKNALSISVGDEGIETTDLVSAESLVAEPVLTRQVLSSNLVQSAFLDRMDRELT